MLPSQVSYWQIQENKRHNLATESQASQELTEVHRHNMVTEDQAKRNLDLGWASLSETQRHNVAYEQETSRHNMAMESETRRHNVVGEDLSYRGIAETFRHNLSSESIDRQRNDITREYNLGQLALGRSRLAIDAGQLGVAQANANTNRINAMTNQYARTTEANAAWNNAITNKNRYALDSNYRPVEIGIAKYRAETERTLGYYNALANMGRATNDVFKTMTVQY